MARTVVVHAAHGDAFADDLLAGKIDMRVGVDHTCWGVETSGPQGFQAIFEWEQTLR